MNTPGASNDMHRDEHPSKVAARLIQHSAFAAVAFIAILVIALGLRFFLDWLGEVHLVERRTFLYWVIHSAEYALEAIDFAMLVGVIAKTAWRLVRGV